MAKNSAMWQPVLPYNKAELEDKIRSSKKGSVQTASPND